ncbi:putative dehydrogenase [Clostridium tetanomorphum]|uniref:Gfo/Idh/MocA family oxidoreductase n=1 Tax=Clostridium tetanomorphum TaxID=1553 RepID=A0A923ECF6_CLOTT|nr:Gfo/Idh/MocA family oxidoreductase [Clostridium tetanomorphum]KAJ53436.1 oxidoreductase [Clostridium tetanomorphum DSM 665]MBC2398489.1 Gfo/Idh/MocA family oxidoreductase [Clostridium tetanomorphum]MBP1865335.1 putative dehydrogenase [Clostridium tetanomorphum]NRS85258.1 putative dehydrogenase [Clostridium tetanomorphum]NRZ98435.1 putative dehydrogenase [Clostridium tetanomorphum]
MNKNIKIGLIGYSSGGRIYNAPIIQSVSGLEIIKIFERKDENIKLANKNFPNALVVSDLEQIFKDDNIDLVVIAVPTHLHYKLAYEALNNNKNVVVEKPFTVTSKEADSLIKFAKEKNKLLTVHHNRRWDSDFRTIKRVIENNIIGNLVQYEAHFDRFKNEIKEDHWKEQDIPGSGMVYDLGSHLIDGAQYLFGLPKEISADIRIERQGGKAPDSFQIILYYTNFKVILKSSMLVRGEVPHYMIFGDKGSFIKYGMDPQENLLRVGKSPLQCSSWGKENEELWGTIDSQINGIHIVGKIESELGDYRSFYHNVYKVLIGEEDLEVTPMQARNTIRIIELAMESSRRKCTISFNL